MISDAAIDARAAIRDALFAIAMTLAAALIGTGVGLLAYAPDTQDRSTTR